MRPEGVREKIFCVDGNDSLHYVSLWHHELVKTESANGKKYIPVNAGAWDARLSGTRLEGSVECIASLPKLIYSSIAGDSLFVNCASSGKLFIWKGDPAHSAIHVELEMPCDTAIRIKDLFGYYEGKVILQLIENKRLKDEDILRITGGKPWLISKAVPTGRAKALPADMILVPGSPISMDVTPGDEFIPYPEISGKVIPVDSFLIDRYPVTNAQYYEFILASGYRPADTSGYLRHWQSGTYKQGQDKYPVVNISYEDMQAYARWAGKRLPTQAEWQMAAQGTDKRKWPWGNDFHGTYCNNSFDRLTPVDAFPKGQSPYGGMDMVGNVWQMTNDIYFNGTNYMGVIRGGSYYKH